MNRELSPGPHMLPSFVLTRPDCLMAAYRKVNQDLKLVGRYNQLVADTDLSAKLEPTSKDTIGETL